MRLSLLVLVALACATAFVESAPSSNSPSAKLSSGASSLAPSAPLNAQHRSRRFAMFGWDVSDFFARAWASMQRAAERATAWVYHLFDWYNRTPHVGKEEVFVVDVPGGGHGLVKVVSFINGHSNKQQQLLWDGRRLAWEQDVKDGHVHVQDGHGGHHKGHGGGGHGKRWVDGRLSITHEGHSYSLPLQILAHHLKKVPAGSTIGVELLGSSWKDLRIVLHVHVRGKHDKKDAKRGISLLVSNLVKELKQYEAQHKKVEGKGPGHGHVILHGHGKEHVKAHGHGKEDVKAHGHGKEDVKAHGHGKENVKAHGHGKENVKAYGHGKEHVKAHGHGKENVKAHGHGKDKKSKKTASSGMYWNGKVLAWADHLKGGKKSHRRARVRVTKDGVAHIIPLRVLAKHLKKVAAGSKIRFEVVGKTLKDTKIILHARKPVAGHQDLKKTVSVPVKLLLREAAASAKKHAVKGSKQLKSNVAPGARQPAVAQV